MSKTTLPIDRAIRAIVSTWPAGATISPQCDRYQTPYGGLYVFHASIAGDGLKVARRMVCTYQDDAASAETVRARVQALTGAQATPTRAGRQAGGRRGGCGQGIS